MATSTMGLGLATNFTMGKPKQRSSSSGTTRTKTPLGMVSCSSTSSYQTAAPCSTGSLVDQYRTLQVQFGASISDVKKAFRQLALQYHPDVCKGSNCKVQFQNINEAYDVVISNLREEEEQHQVETELEEDYDMWEGDDWMLGWEGAGVRDYANPYVYTT